MATLGLALIVRDAADTLPDLLRSIEGHVDRVALVDTGSKDDTIKRFWAWSEQASLSMGVAVKDLEWTDDFSAARTAADELLGDEVEWKVWADADDVIEGAAKLRKLAGDAPPDVVAFMFDYDYAQGPDGSCICTLRRERLVRTGRGKWFGRVHEGQVFPSGGRVQYIEPDVAIWRHAKPPSAEASSQRNLRILKSWLKDEPENPRVLGYLGSEYLGRGKVKQALRYFRRYNRSDANWDEERAQMARREAICLILLDRSDEAEQRAFQAMALVPSWPDSYLTLAEVAYGRGEWQKSIEWASRVIELGQPNTVLIVNPQDYSASPKLLIAGSLNRLGGHDKALVVAEEAVSERPWDPPSQHEYAIARREVKRERTAQTYVMAAEQHVQHDEQLKALTLLDCVPVFAQDHPAVVQTRMKIRTRLRWLLDGDYAGHYETGGSKPEDFVGDDRIDEVCSALSRAHMTLRVIEDLT